MKRYDHTKIEKKWQKDWAKKGLYKTKDKVLGKKNHYLLTEFPYPSGNLHVGHWYAFAVPDIAARALRMQGKNVLYPAGFDAFGLPAENAAIKRGLDPRKWTLQNIAYMKKQMASMGASFDWSREVQTIDPNYYRWTQWMFTQFLKKDLAYRKETPVNWCPKDKTVLANEQVVGGLCERCDSPVEQRTMLQWNLRITDYADRLVDDLDTLDWPQQIKDSQKNWIGRSEGAEIDFPLALPNDHIKRFVLLHCKGGSPDEDFLPWAKTELEKRGYQVQVPTLPNPSEPNDEEQAAYAMAHCTFGEDTAVIGHSFGGIVALRLLESGVKMGHVTLVGTPFTGKTLDGKKRPSVDNACAKGFSATAIKRNVGAIALLYDTHDHIVPISEGEGLASLLSAPLFKKRGNGSHFTSEREPEVLMASTPTIRVFTTRPDTLFGATYLVLAPEHPLIQNLKAQIKNPNEVDEYIAATKRKSDLERQEGKEKTGAKLEGVDAINPATGEKIPVYLADYVLAHYGTGAIMAVPAHDERDFEFAKKFGLPTKQVIVPIYDGEREDDRPRDGMPVHERRAIVAIVKHWSDDSILMLEWKKAPWRTFVTGGIEEGQTPEEAARAEVREETGYTNLRLIKQLPAYHSHFFHMPKNRNQSNRFEAFYFELLDETRVPVDPEEAEKHDIRWVSRSEVSDRLTSKGQKFLFAQSIQGAAITEPGFLVNSGNFAGFSAEKKSEMTAAFGTPKKTYRLRDWIVSRQRYWGVPIPVIHCAACGAVPVPDKDLPVKLPAIKDYLPSGDGKSPLAKADKWKKVKCPQCKQWAERETDTLDTFVDSSWYFLRYTDSKNKKVFADKKKMKEWTPVNLYSGGAEHTTMHLLYSRFWHKALYDLKLVNEPEPYTRRMNRGLIMGPDGQKMSKSRGNVIDPDEIVKRLGGDTVRLYLAFIGPFNETGSYPWNPDGVVGVRRFLERVWKLGQPENATGKPAVFKELESSLHKMIKKVTEDVAALKFNTAIAAMMTFINEAERDGISRSQFETLLKLLAPFAPHITEELWHAGGHKKSIHLEKWPKWDEKKMKALTVTIAVQINGKVRGNVSAQPDASQEDVLAIVQGHAPLAKHFENQTIRRVIYVPQRLINIVIG